jgi:hypothetical protein
MLLVPLVLNIVDSPTMVFVLTINVEVDNDCRYQLRTIVYGGSAMGRLLPRRWGKQSQYINASF